jgi:thymidylate synthase
VIELKAHNVPEAYTEAYWMIKHHGVEENSRNGRVLTIPEPSIIEIARPLQRVLFDPERNANPFFHVMETIWMLSGSDHVGFPSKFNRTYVNYAEADGTVHGAYGKRWRGHFQPKEIGPKFSMDQIQVACALLKKDPESRQVLLSMWDPATDLGATVKDRPCNTHIYFRAKKGGWAPSPQTGVMLPTYYLDMTVCNRSNDLLWGCLGANVVHFTYLQELIAYGAGMDIGTYRVFTNNLHVYSDRADVASFMDGPVRCDGYIRGDVDYFPLIQEGETVERLLGDCEEFVKSGTAWSSSYYNTEWIKKVAYPMLESWEARVDKRFDDSYMFIDRIKAKDWRLACKQWTERKILSYAI